MKRPLIFFLLFLTLLTFATPTKAQDFEVGGIYYNIISETDQVAVTSSPAKYSGSVVIPATVTNSGTTYEVTSIGYEAFAYCNGLTSVTIGERVTSIETYAFISCSGLTSVTIGESVTSIGENAFRNCSVLTSVTIPNSVTSIGLGAFYNCSVLTSATIGESVTSIGENAFSDCSKLTSVIIPNSVTSIGDYAFDGCSGLESVTIGEGVTTIGSSAFSDCSRLTEVTIPNSVTSIGVNAFYNCSGLTEVTIGERVTSIEMYAFSDCSGLTSVTIGESVTSIGGLAFYGCSGLTSVTIPESVTSIGNSAFYNCSGLTSVTSLAETPPTCDYSAFSVHDTLLVPRGRKAAYEAAEEWKNFTIWETPCVVTLQVNNETMGSVSGSDTYAFGAEATLEAVPNPGYHFVKWSDENTNNPRTLTVTEDITLTAEFASETPTPTTTKTDTLYFEFALEEGASSATIEYSFLNDVLSGIEMEYYDGQEHEKFTPTKNGSITVNGNGYGRIYYTYEESAGYSARFLSQNHDFEIFDIDIWCNSANFISLDVSQNTALILLSCGHNQLTSLDVSGCTALTQLFCSDNHLTALDVSQDTALEWLSCGNNQLTSLDVSQNKALKTLFCDNNHLPLSTLYGIYTQRENWQNFFANNQTDTVTLSACEALNLATEKMLGGAETAFELKDEAGNAVSASAYTQDDFSFVFNDAFAGTLTLQNSSVPNASMTYHITAEECATEPPTPTETKTDTIRLEVGKQADNSAIVYNFSNKVKVGIEIEWISEDGISTHFTPDQNGFTADADGYYPQPISEDGQVIIYYTYTSEASPYSLCVKMRSSNDKDINVWLSSAKASSLDVRGCTALTDLDCNFYVVPSLYVSGCTSLTTLDCSCNNLETLDVSGCTALETLDCSLNKLTALDVSGCTALNDLNCYSNQLTTLDVSGCTALNDLNCYSNQLTSLDASGCTSLTKVTMGEIDRLSNLNVSGCSSLTELNCYDYQLTALNVSGCTALTELDCKNNQLTSLDVSDCVALTDLNCSNNQLTALDVSQNTALTTLWCENNQLTSLDVRADTALMHLFCGNNQLTSLDVSKNTALVELDCDDNKLKTLDISQDSALTGLACGRNHIPISTLYGIHAQREEWNYFTAANQTDTISVAMCRALDLSSESPLGETATAFVLKDEAGNAVSAGAYTENGFAFQFNNPATYTLTLQNPAFIGIYWGDPSDYITMTYHITMEECLSVSVSANNGAWGWATQTGNGSYPKDSSVTIIATPQEGYRFVNWTKPEGEVFSINAVYTFAVTEDLTLVANFEEIPEEPVVEETFTLHILANDAAWGSVSQSGNGTYKKDSLATIAALPAEGYRFVNWVQADGAVFGTKADTTFKVVENLILVARFEKIPEVPPVEEDFTVILSVNNPAWGLVFKTGDCVYGEGEEITILALPFAGYRFVNWTKEDGSVFGTDSLITFKVTENLELTANFEEIPDVPVPPVVDTFTVQVSANDVAWGSVSQSGNGTYERDSSVTITATPNEGYRFVNWSKDGAIFSMQADTTFKVTEDLELVANFEKIPDEKPVGDDFHIYVKDNVIYLSEDRGKVQVFNVIGQCLYTGNTTAIRVRQTGVYIISVGGQNYKVLVM